MKINPSTLPCILFLFISITSCQDDDTAAPVPPPKPTVAQPEPLDTANLLPYVFVPGDTTDGFAQGVWQDSFLWEARCGAARYLLHPELEDYLAYSLTTFEPVYGNQRQSIAFDIVPKLVGQYPLKIYNNTIEENFDSTGVFFYTIIDGDDVIGNRYTLDHTATDNHITITEIDTVQKIYKGWFTASFDREGIALSPHNPEHVRLENVSFWGRVVN